MEITLIRKYYDNGTNGVLFLNGKRICYTIELPWKNNERRVSCIPEGRYKIRNRYTTRFGWHCVVENVDNRSSILIHSFNNALAESKGCIGPVTTLKGEGIGIASRLALKDFMAIVTRAFDRLEPVYLTIKKLNDEHINNKGTKADTKVL